MDQTGGGHSIPSSNTLLQVVLVGDGKLGGVGVTLSSLESLYSRGYDVSAVVFVGYRGTEGGMMDNHGCVEDWMRGNRGEERGRCFSLPDPPEMQEEKVEGGDLWNYFDSEGVKDVMREISDTLDSLEEV